MSYDAYLATDRANIAKLKHSDIRVMQQADLTNSLPIIDLSTNPINTLNTQTMAQLGGSITVRKGEAWTGGTVAVDATRSNLRILSITLINGTVTCSSTVTDVPVDIGTNFSASDSISIALPSFPLATVTQASSFVDLTSHPTGNFAAGPTASVALSASTVALISGNSEFRAPRSAFNQNSIDFTKITGVRFRIVATGAATMRVAAIRLLPTAWIQGANGIDTRYNRLRKGIARNGDATAAGFSWPILWRSASPAGEDDPRPIDGEIAVVFNTGSMGAGNQFSIYFREMTEDFMAMLDLNGLSMSSLDGQPQPDTGAARYNARVQSDLDPYPQSILDQESQFSLERTSDSLSSLYISFTVQWSNVGAGISIFNSEGGGYSASVSGITANNNYLAYCILEENSAQLIIYSINSNGNIIAKIYDSTKLVDDFNFKRRAGRFGWYASMADGDAYIDSIRAHGVTYAEYRSLPYSSLTPVVGTELFATNTPNASLLTTMVAGPYNASSTTIVRDTGVSTSGESWRIQTIGVAPTQGLQSNIFSLSDFTNAHISFDIFYPSVALAGSNIVAFLRERDNSYFIPLLIPRILPDQWQTIDIDLPTNQTNQAGEYILVIAQAAAVASTWWIDNPQVYERSIVWDARGIVDDPWLSNSARWTPFYNNYSRENGGVLFERRGNQLQVRARARRQGARIDRIQFRPKYAELGRLIWSTDKLTAPQIAPTAGFSTSSIGTRAIRATSTATDSDGYIALVEWNFGDGLIGMGNIVDHTYAVAGTYTIVQTVMDNNGNRSFTSAPVTV